MTDPLAAHIGWLVWCLDQGYKTAEDRAHLSNWLLEDDATLSDEDWVSKAALLDGADEVIALLGAPLATLRAAVVRMRDEASAEASDRASRSYSTLAAAWDARCSAYQAVLDLIDKREGQ